jgi:hypothetical protein
MRCATANRGVIAAGLMIDTWQGSIVGTISSGAADYCLGR